MTYTVAVVGTGPDPDDPSTDGYAMAYRHAAGYRRIDECTLTASADIVVENAQQFADWWDLPHEAVYQDATRMLREVSPDVVSVCVPPHAHAQVVKECAETGIPAAIHCEEPMAATWGECREMVRACDRRDIQLTFNHQRRFGEPFRKAKSILDEGRRSELAAGNALQATELIFASWESVRRQGRVSLPLDVSDNPIEAMVESGTMRPELGGEQLM